MPTLYTKLTCSLHVDTFVHPALIYQFFSCFIMAFASSSKFLLSVMGCVVTVGAVCSPADARTALPVDPVWHYAFSADGTLNETGNPDNSSSPYFWVSSGAALLLSGGQGGTLQGRLDTGSKWQLLYALSNPRDTENGYLPQNIFRFVTRNTWSDVSEEIRFKINKTNLTDSPNRDGYSGILLMSRYADENNLYYAGIRHDGLAVIKKKSKGSYYTLGTARVWSGTYNRTSNPNLIPEGTWMRLRSDTDTQADGSTKVSLYLDQEDTGSWRKVLEVRDDAGGRDGAPLLGPARTGVRTDFMDVSFDDYIHRTLP
jgi:hypothetical protein